MDHRPLSAVSHVDRRGAGVQLVVVVLVLAFGFVATRSRVHPDAEESGKTAASAPARPPSDAELRQRIQGTWRLEQHGERIVTNHPDGTATMIVRLDFLGSWLYGARLDFKLTWTVENQVLTHSIVSGLPKANVDRLIHDYGSSMSCRILSLDDHTLHLEEMDGSGDRYRWQRWPALR